MAEHKVQLTFGADWTGQKTFSAMHGDIKGMQGSVREFSEVSKHALGQIAGSFSGELSGAIRTTIGVMEELSRGGLWGVAAAGVNLLATSAIKLYQSWKQAAEEHRKLMEAMQSGQQSLIAEQLAAIDTLKENHHAGKRYHHQREQPAERLSFNCQAGNISKQCDNQQHHHRHGCPLYCQTIVNNTSQQ